MLSCDNKENHPKKNFSLKGKIKGDFQGVLYFEYSNILDRVSATDGTFNFEGVVEKPSLAYLILNFPFSNKPMTAIDFMLESENISVFVHYQKPNSEGALVNFLDLYSIRGSKSQDLKTGFELHMENKFHPATNDSIKTNLLYQNLDKFISANP